MLFLTEKLLSLKNKVHRSFSERCIRLREHELNRYEFVMPDNEYMKNTDGLIQKKYLFRVDENGFIMPSRINKDPDLTIVFLGDSTIECLYVDEDNRFPYLVGRLIENRTGLKVNSYNSGVSGSNSFHSIIVLLTKVIPLKPNIVIICHNINDLNFLLYEKNYWGQNPTRSIIFTRSSLRDTLRKIKNFMFPNLYRELANIFHFNIVNKIPDEFAHIRGQKITINREQLLSEFRKNLQIFIDICRDRDTIPVLMTQENRFIDKPDPVVIALMKDMLNSSITYSAYKEIYNLFNQVIREKGEENNILVIDLAKKVPQDKRCIYDVVHFNNNGSRLAANIIVKELEASGFIKKYKK